MSLTPSRWEGRVGLVCLVAGIDLLLVIVGVAEGGGEEDGEDCDLHCGRGARGRSGRRADCQVFAGGHDNVLSKRCNKKVAQTKDSPTSENA